MSITNGFTVDFDEMAEAICDQCPYIRTIHDHSGDYGMAMTPPEQRCPAGAPYDGDFEFDGCDTFYFVQCEREEAALERKAEEAAERMRDNR